MKNLTKLMIPLFAATAFGCADDETKGPIAEPEFGSADSLNSVQSRGQIEFGQALEGSFDEDVTYYGYRFTSLPEGVFTAEITQRGTSRSLDTTMFLFGRGANTNGWERLVFDDDDGWGRFSKIANWEARDFREFQIVVGTVNGLGRGDYRLELTCENDQCLNTDPVEFEGCDDNIFPLFELCVENELENADWGWDDPAEEWSIDYCVNDGGALDNRDWECEVADAFAPEYCRATNTQINAAGPACESRLNDLYHIGPTINLSRLDMPQALLDHAEQLEADSEDWNSQSLDAYSIPASALTDEVAAALRADHAIGRQMTIGSAQNRDSYVQGRFANTALVELLEAEYGTEYKVIEVHGSWAPAAGAEEWVTIEAFVYEGRNIAYAQTSVSGD